MEQRYPDLQLCENLRQQRIEWKIERFAWFFLYLLLVAISLGLFGHGPLAEAALQGPSGSVEMEYKRFMTNKSSALLRVTLPPSSGSARVVLDPRYLDRVQLVKVVPQPATVIAEGEGVAFVFDAESAQPFQVQFFIETQEAGWLESWISVAGGPRQRFSQFVYP